MEIFQELLELKWYTIVILVALILLGIAFYKTAKQGSFLNTKRLSYAAMCLACLASSSTAFRRAAP